MEKTNATKYTPDQNRMIAAVKIVAQAIMAGQVSALAIVASTATHRIIGHHVVHEVGDASLLRGLLAECSDQVRDAYVKDADNAVPLFGPDGAQAK